MFLILGAAMDWRRRVPSSVAFVDVETTGLTDHDRVVSLGAVWLSTASVGNGPFPVSYIHLIYNPGIKCNPAAVKVHGYSDQLLSQQESFDTRAKFIREYLSCADLVVAHNAAFDLNFLNREFRYSGEAALDRRIFCTMEACRERGLPSAALASVCAHIGISRSSRSHGALEDSWLAMMVYLWLHGCSTIRPFSDLGKFVQPFNFRALDETINVQPISNTGLNAAGSTPEAARISALVESIKLAKREHRFADAEKALLGELDRQEQQAKMNGSGVAPWYYEQLAIIYSKQKRYTDEIAVLQRYDRQPKAPGAMPVQLKERLEKVTAKHRMYSAQNEDIAR
jgi:DNA polymerase III subunit epsilon